MFGIESPLVRLTFVKVEKNRRAEINYSTFLLALTAENPLTR